MKVRHATPGRNVESILRRGLLTSMSRGRRKAVWLHVGFKTAWACVHVAERHSVLYDEVVVIELDVPSHRLIKHGGGIYFVKEDIDPILIEQAFIVDRIMLHPMDLDRSIIGVAE